jgi:hypothetical protein
MATKLKNLVVENLIDTINKYGIQKEVRRRLTEQDAFNSSEESGSGRGADAETTAAFKNIALEDPHTNGVAKKYASEIKANPSLKDEHLSVLETLIYDLVQTENKERGFKDKFNNYQIKHNVTPAANALIDHFTEFLS